MKSKHFEKPLPTTTDADRMQVDHHEILDSVLERLHLHLDEDYQLIICDDDKVGLLRLNESDDVIESVFDEQGFLRILK